jgi:hypothetical protein
MASSFGTSKMIFIGAYVAIAIVVTLLARIVDDPYGHFRPREDWLQAVWIGVFWMPYLFFVLAACAFDWIRRQLDPRD